MQDFKAEMHEIPLPLRLRPRIRWWSVLRSPDFLAVFKGHIRLRRYNRIQYNIRLLEAVRTQRRTIIERVKYVENENVKMVHNE